MTWRQWAETKPTTPATGEAVAVAIESGAASLLALEMMLAEISTRPEEHLEAQDELRTAIALVRSAVMRAGGGLQSRDANQLAYGFVTRRSRS